MRSAKEIADDTSAWHPHKDCSCECECCGEEWEAEYHEWIRRIQFEAFIEGVYSVMETEREKESTNVIAAALHAAVMKAAGYGHGGNLESMLPERAQQWAKKTAVSLHGIYPNRDVLYKIVHPIVAHAVRYNREELGL